MARRARGSSFGTSLVTVGRLVGEDDVQGEQERPGILARDELGHVADRAHATPAHAAVTPPSTGSAAPVINDASSERRKSAALAISSGRPVRPSGTEPWARLCTSASGFIPTVDF